MADNDLQDVVDELADVDEIRAKRLRVLKQLLDESISQERKFIAVRGHMGTTLSDSGSSVSVPSYSCMHTLEWVGRKGVFMGSEMDFLKNNIDPKTNRLIIDEESAELLRQRAPDWSRQLGLTAYLLQEANHKFGTILAVLSLPWVDNPKHEKWGKDGRALESSTKFESLDSEGRVGLLDLNEISVYALDGQHRVMGIRGLIDVKEGGITIKKPDGSESNKRISKEEFLERLQTDVTGLSNVLYEKINIEYIPAVMKGETRKEATQRIRKIFNAINNQAKTPDKGENILLDENHGGSIVARKIGHHKIFYDLNGKSRVNWKRPNITGSDKVEIITLTHLREVVMNSLNNLHKEGDAFHWEAEFKTVPLRPPESELLQAEKEVKELLDRVMQLPTFKALAAGDDLVELREFPSEEKPNRKGSLLVRPIGIPILLEAVTRALEKSDLDTIFKKLARFDREAGFEAYRPNSIFYMVTYDARNRRMDPKQAKVNLAEDLLAYLLVGGPSEVRDTLSEKVVEMRSFEDLWMDYDGNQSPRDDHPTLPIVPLLP